MPTQKEAFCRIIVKAANDFRSIVQKSMTQFRNWQKEYAPKSEDPSVRARLDAAFAKAVESAKPMSDEEAREAEMLSDALAAGRAQYIFNLSDPQQELFTRDSIWLYSNMTTIPNGVEIRQLLLLESAKFIQFIQMGASLKDLVSLGINTLRKIHSNPVSFYQLNMYGISLREFALVGANTELSEADGEAYYAQLGTTGSDKRVWLLRHLEDFCILSIRIEYTLTELFKLDLDVLKSIFAKREDIEKVCDRFPVASVISMRADWRDYFLSRLEALANLVNGGYTLSELPLLSSSLLTTMMSYSKEVRALLQAGATKKEVQSIPEAGLEYYYKHLVGVERLLAVEGVTLSKLDFLGHPKRHMLILEEKTAGLLRAGFSIDQLAELTEERFRFYCYNFENLRTLITSRIGRLRVERLCLYSMDILRALLTDVSAATNLSRFNFYDFCLIPSITRSQVIKILTHESLVRAFLERNSHIRDLPQRQIRDLLFFSSSTFDILNRYRGKIRNIDSLSRDFYCEVTPEKMRILLNFPTSRRALRICREYNMTPRILRAPKRSRL